MSIHEVSNDEQAMPATESAPGPAATEDAPAASMLMSIHEVSNDGHATCATGSAPGSAATEDAPAASMLMSIHEVSNDGHAMPATGSAPGPAATEDAPAPVKNFQTGAAPQPSQIKTFFGLPRDSRRQGFSRPAFDDDYVERFPEDPYGQETKPNARIWRVYVEEAVAFDENMVGQSRDGLDVMLVFAGLFSAVVTSFLVQVSQNLQADFSEMSALLLHDLLIVQLSMVDGATVNVTTPSVDPAAKFEPDTIDVWINGLWVVSLVTSLVVALSAVLVKQWLHRYMTYPSGTPGLRSHVRQFRFMGLEKWRVRIIIGMLPIVMHISLILFFAGLALFYIPLRTSLAWVVGTITVFVFVLYFVSNTIPIIYLQCPYQTPFTDFIHHVCQIVLFAIRGHAAPSRLSSDSAPGLESNFKSLTRLESEAVEAGHATLSVDALDWLYQASSNPTVHTLVLQGISGLTAASRSCASKKWDCATDMQSQRLQLVREALQSPNFPSQPWHVERLCRSCLFLPPGNGMDSLDVVCDTKSDDWDPCIKAALRIWLVHDWTVDDFKNFFISHSEVPMHPLIWERIIRYLLNQYPVRPCALFASPSEALMTGPQVVWTVLQSQFWDSILGKDLLAPYDTLPGGPISSYNRTLIAAGELALSLVRQYHHNVDDSSQQHLELLAGVVRLIAGPNVEFNMDCHRMALDFLISVLDQIQDVSLPATESENNNSPLSACLDHIRSFYHRSSSMQGFHFPALDCFLQGWADFYDCVQYDSVFTLDRPSDLKTPLAVLHYALDRGHEEAYQIFTSRGGMRIIFTEWAICGDKEGEIFRLIKACLCGLRVSTRPDTKRREFCKYLHQPQQLILILMLMAAASFGMDFELFIHVKHLARICPTHRSWRDCDTALKAILVWGQTPDPEISLFPWPAFLHSLETTEAFRKYPLVEWTACRFAGLRVQDRLKITLEVLHEVLDDAEHVDGVLMPNLENQLALDAAGESEGVYVASDGD